MTAAEIIRFKGPEVVSISASASAREAAKLLRSKNIGAVLVRDGRGRAVGLLTERDLVGHLAEVGTRLADAPVTEIMTVNMRTCAETEPVRNVMETMTRYRVRHLPVVDEHGDIKGIISIGDVIKQRLRDLETETNVLRDIIVAGQ